MCVMAALLFFYCCLLGGVTKHSGHWRLDLNISTTFKTTALPRLLFSTAFSSILDIFFRFGGTNLAPTSLQQLKGFASFKKPDCKRGTSDLPRILLVLHKKKIKKYL